ncbi:hypothetical protein [Ktedonobacter robiniae]|uniref:Uncharacterized protein n=1 Tax=Ktedonobacter robiniae TaxID=2778365 RepID=A0ABQ3UST7_9CHLR|nr:hypothetical protein [Ktedonobacter robiniae]GHO55505.1 hypothetical protein KSB_39800 [Ktedonobacter robiniae]
MGPFNHWHESLGFFAFPGLFVPAERTPDGQYRYFKNGLGYTVEKPSLPQCLAFLSSVYLERTKEN